MSENEEPHLGPDLESLIELMTDQPADDDEGIDVERDSDDSQGKDQSIFQDVIDVSKALIAFSTAKPYTHVQCSRLIFVESILMGVCNTVPSAYTLYRHLG